MQPANTSATTLMATAEVIKRYYEAVNKADWDTWLTLFDERIVMDEQLAGHLEGINTLQNAVVGLKRGYSRFQMMQQHTAIDNGIGCVFWHCSAANAAGVPIEADGANYFEVRNGKITYMATRHDTVPFLPFTSQKFS